MTALNADLLIEVAVLLAYALAAGILTALGAAAEYFSLQYLGSGELVVALWLAAMGAIMLYAGVVGIGYRKLFAQIVG